ncbi:Sec-independent protein translocase subunit TatA [Tsukamurella soli]|uniref:Sec-independent protein translocase protein TatA n=1 Tax=Tsukamurella soli TaxID=644556 RepID=A0ABP8J320_9ACTN
MGAIQPWHIIVVLVVALILFGSKKLPEAARGLGRSMRIFKSEINEMKNEGQAEDRPRQELTSPAPAAPVDVHVDVTKAADPERKSA